MDRVRFEIHREKKILIIDCSGCSAPEMMKLFDRVLEMVTTEPRGSVLTLSDLTGAQFTREAITRMKEVAALDRPHVRRAAIVGVDTLPEVYHKALQTFSVREFPIFATHDEALDYLLEEEAAGRQSA